MGRLENPHHCGPFSIATYGSQEETPQEAARSCSQGGKCHPRGSKSVLAVRPKDGVMVSCGIWQENRAQAQPLMGPLCRGLDKPGQWGVDKPGLSDPRLCPGVMTQPCCLPRPPAPWPSLPARAGEVLLQGHRHGPQQHLAPDEARLSRHLLDPLHDLLPHPRHPHVGRGLHFPQRVHQAPLFAASERQGCGSEPAGSQEARVTRVSVHTRRHPVYSSSHRCTHTPHATHVTCYRLPLNSHLLAALLC